MLLVLLLGVADFARVFAAGIAVEASARNAAEAAAQEYLQLARNKTGGVLGGADYTRLHEVALDTVCREGTVLPNHAESSGSCTMPVAGVCIHDGVDPDCGVEAASAPGQCPALKSTWNAANTGATISGKPPLPYVEVRVCYQFTPIFASVALPFGWGITLGEIYLERGRQFTVANY
jgi:hypothetical protein